MKARDLQVQFIDFKTARAFITKHHYSKSVVSNSKIHFGIFFNKRLRGVMSFGTPTDKRKILNLFDGSLSWGAVIELNRMACDNTAPRNTESRALSVAFKLLTKHYPQIKYVISFSDATTSGDGTIYRAAGFHLTKICRNTSILEFPSGDRVAALALETSPDSPRPELVTRVADLTLRPSPDEPQAVLGGRTPREVCGGQKPTRAKIMKATGAKYAAGFQLRYIKSLYNDMSAYRGEILPYSAIDDAGARMYLGERV